MHKLEFISVEELKEESDEVLKLLYEDNRSKFLNFARRYNLPDEDLIDVYQEAYIAFYHNVMNGKIQSFTSSISTYIISIGKYIIYDTLKKNKRKLNPDYDLSILIAKDELIDQFEIDQEELTTEQKLLKIHFSTLGNKCKELLDMFYYRGFTIKDILKHSDYNSENVIKSAKSRCLKTLKERIFNS